ncbi:MAG: hypothetical protein GY795_16110 [Desulfobacterales bacterium]|nr:hypothetical protein [Desulfobacterales bacterium]
MQLFLHLSESQITADFTDSADSLRPAVCAVCGPSDVPDRRRPETVLMTEYLRNL